MQENVQLQFQSQQSIVRGSEKGFFWGGGGILGTGFENDAFPHSPLKVKKFNFKTWG